MNAKFLNQKVDIILIGVFLVLMTFSARELWFVPLKISDTKDRMPLGELSAKNNEVVWKQNESLSWNQGNIGEEFYQGDEIFTYEGATATLFLQDQGSITLEQKTLLKLEKNDEGVSTLNIEKGSLIIDLAPQKSLTLKSRGKTIKLKTSAKASQIKLSQDLDKPAIRVISGEVQLTDKKTELQLTSNDQVEISQSEIMTIEPPEVIPEKVFAPVPRPVVSQPDAQIVANQFPVQIPIAFNWNSETPLDSERQQFELFLKNSPTKKYIINHEMQSLNLEFAKNGRFEVHLAETIDLNTQIYPFSVVTITEPSPLPSLSNLLPSNKAVLYLAEVKIPLSWQGNEQATNYELEVLSENKKREIYRSNTNSFEMSANSKGSFQWRVRALEESSLVNSSGPWSPWQKFDYFPLGALPKNPKQGIKLELKSPDEKVSLAWRPTLNQPIKHYLVEIASDSDFKSPIKRFQTSQAATSFVLGKAGTFYWRAKVISKDGKVSFSPPTQVEIIPGKAPPPPKIPKLKKIKIKPVSQSSPWLKFLNFLIPQAHADALGVVVLEWEEVPDAIGYRIEIYRDANQKTLIHKADSKTNSLNWTVPEAGTFYWRVATLDPWNRLLTYSPLSQLLLEIDDTLQKQLKKKAAIEKAKVLEREQKFASLNKIYLGKLRLQLKAANTSWSEVSSQHQVDYSGIKTTQLDLAYFPSFFLHEKSRIFYSLNFENMSAKADERYDFTRRLLFLEGGWHFAHAPVHSLSLLLGQETQTSFPLLNPTNPNSGINPTDETQMLLGVGYQGKSPITSIQFLNYIRWFGRLSSGALTGVTLGTALGFSSTWPSLELGLNYQSYSTDVRQGKFQSLGLSFGFIF